MRELPSEFVLTKIEYQPHFNEAGTTVLDLFNVLRELGLADQTEFYEQYLERKYGHGSRGLSAEEITEQFVSLSRCKRDAAKLKQLTDYFELLENYRKAA